MRNTTTFTLYVTKDLLARLDAAADRAAVSRNAYVLSWLPENYDQPADPDGETPASNGTQQHS